MVLKSILFGVAVLFAVLTLGLAVWDGLMVVRLRRHGRRVQGTVIDKVPRQSNKSTVWLPIVGFTDHLGYPIEFAPQAHRNWKWQVGRTVALIYPPDNPQNVRLDSWMHLGLGTILLFVLGTGCIAGAVGVALNFNTT